MSTKEFVWGVLVVVAGLIVAQYVTPMINQVLGRVIPTPNG